MRTPDERRAWLAARGERHPVLIAERGGAVLAWASLNPFNPRAAYAHVADLSIYVARSARGSGVGRVLLGRIIDEARGLGFHKMVLAAFPTQHRRHAALRADGLHHRGDVPRAGLPRRLLGGRHRHGADPWLEHDDTASGCLEQEWLGVWTNEMHADYLAHDRLAEARAQAARQALLAELRAQRPSSARRWVARLIAGGARPAGAGVDGGRAAYEPPVTSMVTPVTKSASLEARKQMTRA